MKISSSQAHRNVVALGQTDFLPAIGLALAAAIVMIPGLGLQSLASWDEAVHGVAARELLARPRLTLYYGGNPWFDKPPLLFWLMAATSSVFGLTEFALRLPSAISGIGAVVLTYFIGRRLGGRAAGLLAAICLLGVPQFVAYSRLAMTDIPLVALGMLSIFLVMYGKNQPAMTIAAGAAFGLALLTKSIAAFLFLPGLIAIIVALRGLRALWSRDIVAAAFAALVVALPWYLWLAMTHGRPFIEEHLIFHVLNRLRPLQGHEGDRLFYFYLYWVNAGWLALFHSTGIVVATCLALRNRDRLLGAIVIFALGTFLIVNAQATKIGWYLTPVYAGAAVAAAVAITRILPNHSARVAAILLLILLAIPGILHGRAGFVEGYNILDYSPEIRSLRNVPPFINTRVPALYVVKVADPAPRFYLADKVKSIDQDELERLVAANQPFLCLTFKWFADEFLNRHPQAGLAIVASAESLAVIERR
jgi:4-amino-4-deoxy-L-arabinose transferase-like glycosyltransferase